MPPVLQDCQRGFLPETLRSVTAFFSHRPSATIGCVLLVPVLCLATTGQFIQFKTKGSDLIDPGVVRATLDEIAEQLRKEGELFEPVLYKVDLRPPRRKGLQDLSPERSVENLRIKVNSQV